jgi:hypothetical protein
LGCTATSDVVLCRLSLSIYPGQQVRWTKPHAQANTRASLTRHRKPSPTCTHMHTSTHLPMHIQKHILGTYMLCAHTHTCGCSPNCVWMTARSVSKASRVSFVLGRYMPALSVSITLKPSLCRVRLLVGSANSSVSNCERTSKQRACGAHVLNVRI